MEKTRNRIARLVLYSAIAGTLTNHNAVYETRLYDEKVTFMNQNEESIKNSLLKNILRHPIETIEIIINPDKFGTALNMN